MSAPKQLAKRQKLERKRRRKRESFLNRKKRQQPCWGRPDFDYEPSLVANGPVGGFKMSDVLQEFASPLIDETADGKTLRRVFSIAVLEWNAALEPVYSRSAFIASGIDGAMKNTEPWERLACRELIESLVARKLAHFARYQRPIMAFQLDELDDGGYYLSVASGVC
jgi:hypothetical protein